MRKSFKLLITSIVGCIIMANCVSANEDFSQSDSWQTVQTVDEFGDVTEDSDLIVGKSEIGTFSNTATQDEEMTVSIGFLKKENEQYVIQFLLKEYNSTPATYTSDEEILLKTKIDDEVSEYVLEGMPPNGNVFLGYAESDFGGNTLFNELYQGKDIKCIIYIGTSHYNFTISSNNFSSICDDVGFKTIDSDEMIHSALYTAALQYLYEDAMHDDASAIINENTDTLELLDKTGLSELLKGDFFEIGFDMNLNYHPWLLLERFSSDTAITFAQFSGDYFGAQKQWIREYEGNTNAPLQKIVINDEDYTSIIEKKNTSSTYRVYKLNDNMYISSLKKEDGSFKPTKIMIKCGIPVTETPAYETFVSKMIEIATGENIENEDLSQGSEIDNVDNSRFTDAETVKKVQEALNNAGYDCGNPDGDKGPKTTSIIQQYQTDNGLEATGEIDDALLNSLGIQ